MAKKEPKKVKVELEAVIYEKDTMFLRLDVGKAEGPDGTKYEMSVNTGGYNPIIQSKKTGKWFLLSWQAILAAAIEAGIDEEEK